ncbi:RNA-binding S4 domain-containing protein [Novosphingobium aerophilum]|uniref:RNA-binding S4 domain-containing protein n=1 Tax=Novosphingobium TaxID=165696 RepID=UPI0006C896A6|nr:MULTISPECIES: RNA-binding S4 domain-containing protein [unclassified Novosphingobium]KPH57429.1 RNA-binding protein [Novosphingobium sp. ST904]MPS67429.1 RNA-binding S4 domain-containing protein [Novosphingobium sp.]TCM42965.1 ribosome-associated heat shock protein Hsp15 [Novosphingobium sp. ST904]WRT93301.1 RNA-binding S4 domain-containing protein [Novosphingobium sp. RL4]
MRIDKLLWFLRLTKTRPLAQAMAEDGHIRLNGRRVERAHQKVGPGDVLTVPTAGGVRVIEILSLPERRGPAPEVQACYRVLDAGADVPIAAANRNEAF